MEEKTRITLKLTLGPLTTLWDLKQFAATALQVMDRPELTLVNDVPRTETGAGRLALVAAGTPKPAQPAGRGPEAPKAPKVPDRITEWPEDDTALRAYPWRDTLGLVWRYGVTDGEHGWSTWCSRAWKKPFDGPWTREEGADR